MRFIPGQATPQEPPKGPHLTANMIYIAHSDLALDGPVAPIRAKSPGGFYAAAPPDLAVMDSGRGIPAEPSISGRCRANTKAPVDLKICYLVKSDSTVFF